MQAHERRARPQAVQRYYDATHRLYQTFWSREGLHYGLWERDTFTLQAAIRNTDYFVGRQLGLPPGSRVLDAGCGVGGTARNLARTLGHRVTGVTLSEVQAGHARAKIKRAGLESLVDVQEEDYTRLPFDDDSFDGIYSVEALCHAGDKSKALREFKRVLKPGGKLLVVDGFRASRRLDDDEERKAETFLEGWQVAELEPIDRFQSLAKTAGFEAVRADELNDKIMPTARLMEAMAYTFYAPVGLPAKYGLLPHPWYLHGMACFAQKALFEKKAFVYAAVHATA